MMNNFENVISRFLYDNIKLDPLKTAHGWISQTRIKLLIIQIETCISAKNTVKNTNKDHIFPGIDVFHG